MFIIVAVPYLMAVANFFVEAMPKVEGKQKAAVQKHTDVICKLNVQHTQYLLQKLTRNEYDHISSNKPHNRIFETKQQQFMYVKPALLVFVGILEPCFQANFDVSFLISTCYKVQLTTSVTE